MKNIFSLLKAYFYTAILLISFSSCQDFMSQDSNRYMPADENTINTPNDSAYSVVGILTKVQKLSDKYVLLGELRADLMDVSDKSSEQLRDLSNLRNLSSNNYCDPTDYYSVINNCNYFIKNANINANSHGLFPFLNEVAAVKVIRAWTYMQLVLNYGTVLYTEEPILSIEDAKKQYPEMNTTVLIDTLIAQISRFDPNVNYASYFPRYTSDKKLFVDPLFMLGDLFLWRASYSHAKADYESAALYYAMRMRKEPYATVPNSYSVYWGSDSFKYSVDNWSRIFFSSSDAEIMTRISLASNSSLGTVTALPSLASSQSIVASSVMNRLYDNQWYAYKVDVTTIDPAKFIIGDLRKAGAMSTYTIFDGESMEERIVLSKFSPSYVTLYRNALLYLRYAEAVNRAGKPNLAFATLKYGLNVKTLGTPTYIPAAELADNKEYVNLLKNDAFVGNVGIHSRGCGNSVYNTMFIIPDGTVLATKSDSINYVENLICDELALETSFEGNRFQDLMRFSRHKNDPTFLAKKVGAKHAADSASIAGYLSTESNWYLPFKK